MSGSNSSARDAALAAEPLTLTVHRVEAPDLGAAAARSSTRRGRLMMLLILAVCAAPVVASYLTYYVIRPHLRTTNYGTLIQPTRGLPDAVLHRLDGTPVPARSLRGQWLLVAVGPAACDSACQRRLYTQRQLREMLGAARDRVDKVWLVSDGAPVAPALQAALAAQPPVTVLRIDPKVLADWLAPAPGHALQDHLYIVDPMGEWMMRMPAHPDPMRMKADLDRLLRASASWDVPKR